MRIKKNTPSSRIANQSLTADPSSRFLDKDLMTVSASPAPLHALYYTHTHSLSLRTMTTSERIKQFIGPTRSANCSSLGYAREAECRCLFQEEPFSYRVYLKDTLRASMRMEYGEFIRPDLIKQTQQLARAIGDDTCNQVRLTPFSLCRSH
jgi:hypothetical protein